MNFLIAETNVGVETMNKWGDVFVESFQDAFAQIVGVVPSLLAMLVVLLVGYMIARVASRVATAVSSKVGLQTAAERSGLVESMTQVGIQRTVPSIVGTIVFWLLMCIFLMAGFNILGWTGISEGMATIIAYIPNILVATVVVVVGLLLATFLRGVIATSADRAGLSYAQSLATGCYYVMALMIFMAAFDHLKIEFALLNYAILIAFAALAIGAAIAFGLGGREVVGGILAGYYVRQRMQAGDTVRIADLKGTVRDVGPVATIVETDEGGLMHRHSVPNIRMLNEAIR